MSSIEKAVERLEANTLAKGGSRNEAENASRPKPAERFSEYKEPERSVAAEKRDSRQVTLDLKRLGALGMVTPETSKSQLAEEYRNIKRPLLKNALGQGASVVENGNLIMVTSSLAGEGKTFTSVNLAMSIAMELDRTVLLVDADVARRGVSGILGFEPGAGLTDLLMDNSMDVGEVLIKTNVPKLTLMSAGRRVPNATELMASENMQGILGELANRYPDRIILLDSPPLMETSEARVLAGLAGQIMVVIEAEKTPQVVVQEALGLLDSTKIIGLILNKSRQPFGHGGYYGYGYGYGSSGQ